MFGQTRFRMGLIVRRPETDWANPVRAVRAANGSTETTCIQGVPRRRFGCWYTIRVETANTISAYGDGSDTMKPGATIVRLGKRKRTQSDPTDPNGASVFRVVVGVSYCRRYFVLSSVFRIIVGIYNRCGVRNVFLSFRSSRTVRDERKRRRRSVSTSS